MPYLTIRFALLFLTSIFLSNCGSPDRPTEVTEDSLPAKAPKERTEALDERQTEWSQSTYAEDPGPDSLVNKITDTIPPNSH
jgi:hypothetical protein